MAICPATDIQLNISGSVAKNLFESCELIMTTTVIPKVSDKHVTSIFRVEDRFDFKL
jgi:hypothetical protein